MDTLYKILNKMKKRDLIWISKYLKIYFNNSDTKSILINRLLNPLSKKYKIGLPGSGVKKTKKPLHIQIDSSAEVSEEMTNITIIGIIKGHFKSLGESSLLRRFLDVPECQKGSEISTHIRHGSKNIVKKHKDDVIKFIDPVELNLTEQKIQSFIKEIFTQERASVFADVYNEKNTGGRTKTYIKIPEIFQWGICKNKHNKYVLFVEMENLEIKKWKKGEKPCLKTVIKQQLKEFLEELYKDTGIVHNDLHFGNISYNGKYIAIIDWGESEILNGSPKHGDFVQQNQMENNIKECPKETTP